MFFFNVEIESLCILCNYTLYVFSRNIVVKVELTYLVEVEREFARDGAVEPSLEVGGPVLAEDVLATRVAFADARNPRIHVLATVDVLYCRLSVEEQDVLTNVIRAHKLRFCNKASSKKWINSFCKPGFDWDISEISEIMKCKANTNREIL